MKKIRLQEQMSGLKHQFSTENGPKSKETLGDDDDIDPADECNDIT